MLESATRMQRIAPFYVMDLLAKARQIEASGRTVIHMEIGEPDFATPQPIIDAGINALNAGQTHYTPALGLPALRAAIAGYYHSHYSTVVEPANVIVTPGSSGALQLAITVLVNPGDEVLLTDPGYPCNKHFVQLAGGVAKFINLSQDNNYALSLAAVKAQWTDKTKVIMLASPANPTGMTIQQEVLQAIADFARSKNAFLIVDEIYQGLEYGARLKTLAGQFDNVFVINSFSKFFCMTGWRVGWLVSPSAFVNDIDKLAQNIFLAAPTLAQHAALQAFEAASLAILEGYRQAFQARRDYLYNALQELGFGLSEKPAGAFYIYANSEHFSADSYQFCFDLLEQAGVAITPGKDFSQTHPEKFVRFAYTREIPQLEEGIARLKSFISAE